MRLGQFDEAVKAASGYKDNFGEGRYFLELMDYGIEIERRVRDGLLEIGRKLDIPPLVTNDSHYTYANEATAHDALLSVQAGKNLSDPDKYEVDVITKQRVLGYFLVVADFLMRTKNNGIAVVRPTNSASWRVTRGTVRSPA